MNVVVLEGRLSGLPPERTLDSGSRVLSLQLTIDRREGQRAAESVPVAWFDPKMRVLDFEEEQRLVVVGRVVRRFFRTGTVVQSRTEVVADRIVPATRTSSVRTALASVMEEVATGLEGRAPAGPRKGSRARAGADPDAAPMG